MNAADVLSPRQRAAVAASAAHLRLSEVMIALAPELPAEQARFFREQLQIMRSAVEAMQAALDIETTIDRAARQVTKGE